MTTATSEQTTLQSNDKEKTFYFTVQVVEAQRRYVLTGWTGRARFPLDPYEWSDTAGQCSRPTRELDHELPRGAPYPCEWVSDWQIYLGTDEKDWYAGGKGETAKKGSPKSSPTNANTSSKNNSKSNFASAVGDELVDNGVAAPLKYTRFDDDGWEYAFDYPRTFRNQQSATMSWVRRRFWRRTFMVKAPSVEDVEDDVPFPDRFRICMLDGPTDWEREQAVARDYLSYRPAPRVSDYKVGLRRIGLKLYNPSDAGGAPRSRSQSAEKQRKKQGTETTNEQGSPK